MARVPWDAWPCCSAKNVIFWLFRAFGSFFPPLLFLANTMTVSHGDTFLGLVRHGNAAIQPLVPRDSFSLGHVTSP
jgi:hypothetical protein